MQDLKEEITIKHILLHLITLNYILKDFFQQQYFIWHFLWNECSVKGIVWIIWWAMTHSNLFKEKLASTFRSILK